MAAGSGIVDVLFAARIMILQFGQHGLDPGLAKYLPDDGVPEFFHALTQNGLKLGRNFFQEIVPACLDIGSCFADMPDQVLDSSLSGSRDDAAIA